MGAAWCRALGMFTAFSMMLVLQYLAAEREDGTLLRAARAIPDGISGYLIGKLAYASKWHLGKARRRPGSRRHGCRAVGGADS